MPYTLPPIALTENQTSAVNIPGSLGSVTYLKMVNASPYLLAINNLLGGSDYMQPGEANVWPVPGLSTAVQVTPQQFGINPAIIPSTVLVVTWYLEGEQPNGNYPVNFNTLSYVGNSIVSNSPANVFEQDLFTPFVLTGYDATKDGVTANQLDVASGVAFLRQSSDNSQLRIANNATSFLTTTPSATYFLDLNPDGSWSFATTHSGVANHLTIASATTDGSGNISAVTDARVTASTLLSAMAGLLTLPGLAKLNSDAGRITTDGNGQMTIRGASGDYNAFDILSPLGTTQAIIGSGDASYVNGSGYFVFTGGGPDGYAFRNWDGTGGTISGAIKSLGQQATVGSFGVPMIVAQAIDVHVTATTQQTILSYTPGSTGWYRVSGGFAINNGTPGQNITFEVVYTDPHHSGQVGLFGIGLTPGVSVGAYNALNMTNVLGTPLSMPIHAQVGQSISVTYQDAGGTPSDYVSAIIERLS